MVVGSKQGFRTQLLGVGCVFQHSTGDGHAIIGGSAATDLIQNQQAFRSGMFQNSGNLRHFHHKGGLT